MRKQDLKEAAHWLTKAAEQGNVQAQYDLGALYADGKGVGRDLRKSAEWTRRAADAGLSAAELEYAIMLFKGRGVAKDQDRAAFYLKSAAGKGNPVAQNRLARLYAHGVALKADMMEAAKWHMLARAAGVSDFQLDFMLSKLTEAQRLAAEKAAEDWSTQRALR